jgi:transposase InsO family protein
VRVEDQAHRAGFELIRELATRTSIESWCSTVRSEEAERLESYAHAKEALFDYIEVLSNQRRRHSTLGQISPAEFERRTTHGA